MAQRTKEVRPYVKPQTVYKQSQTEVLHVVERNRIDTKTKVSGHNTGKKYECYAQ